MTLGFLDKLKEREWQVTIIANIIGLGVAFGYIGEDEKAVVHDAANRTLGLGHDVVGLGYAMIHNVALILSRGKVKAANGSGAPPA
jgi:hypothetical protein